MEPPKYSSLKPEAQARITGHINTRWKQLYELDKAAVDTPVHLLFLTNSGGAVATLSFIGAIGKNRIADEVKWSLMTFLLALISLGIYHAKQHHHLRNLFLKWQEGVADLYADRKDWPTVLAEDKARIKVTFWDYFFPYVAFGLFVMGCGLGFSALW